MASKIISKTLTIPAGTETPVILFKTTLEKDYCVNRLYVHIPSGWEYDAGVKFYIDELSIPADITNDLTEKVERPFLTGNGVFYTMAIKKRVNSHSEFSVAGYNKDPTNDHSFTFVLELLEV